MSSLMSIASSVIGTDETNVPSLQLQTLVYLVSHLEQFSSFSISLLSPRVRRQLFLLLPAADLFKLENDLNIHLGDIWKTLCKIRLNIHCDHYMSSDLSGVCLYDYTPPEHPFIEMTWRDCYIKVLILAYLGLGPKLLSGDNILFGVGKYSLHSDGYSLHADKFIIPDRYQTLFQSHDGILKFCVSYKLYPKVACIALYSPLYYDGYRHNSQISTTLKFLSCTDVLIIDRKYFGKHTYSQPFYNMTPISILSSINTIYIKLSLLKELISELRLQDLPFQPSLQSIIIEGDHDTDFNTDPLCSKIWASFWASPNANMLTLKDFNEMSIPPISSTPHNKMKSFALLESYPYNKPRSDLFPSSLQLKSLSILNIANEYIPLLAELSSIDIDQLELDLAVNCDSVGANDARSSCLGSCLWKIITSAKVKEWKISFGWRTATSLQESVLMPLSTVTGIVTKLRVWFYGDNPHFFGMLFQSLRSSLPYLVLQIEVDYDIEYFGYDESRHDTVNDIQCIYEAWKKYSFGVKIKELWIYFSDEYNVDIDHVEATLSQIAVCVNDTR